MAEEVEERRDRPPLVTRFLFLEVMESSVYELTSAWRQQNLIGTRMHFASCQVSVEEKERKKKELKSE
jgi:hypothetical protein